MQREKIEYLVGQINTALLMPEEVDSHLPEQLEEEVDSHLPEQLEEEVDIHHLLEQLEAVMRDYHDLLCQIIEEQLDSYIGKFLEGYFELSNGTGIQYL